MRFADAVRMATLHPAAYLGLERHLGAIAPGRLADVLVLPGEDEPVPEQVYVGGVPVARHQRLLVPQVRPDWTALGLGPLPDPGEVDAGIFTMPAAAPMPGAATGASPAHGEVAPRAGEVSVPVIELLNAVITRRGATRLPVRDGCIDFTADPQLCLAVLLPGAAPGAAAPGQTGGPVRALVRGFGRVAGLATSYTCAFAPLVIGRNPQAMARALRRILAAGGGISLWDEDGERFFLPLEVAGHMTDLPLADLADRCLELGKLLQERGHPFHDPLYTLLFLTANHLPTVRLTRMGLWDVKRREVVAGAAGW